VRVKFVGEGQPARSVDVGRLEDGIDLVLGLQALGDDLELQSADRAEQQRAAGEVFEDLDGAFFAEFLQAFLQLLALQRIAQAGDAEEFGREVGDALEGQRFAFGQAVADVQVAVVVDADDVAGDGVFHQHAFVGHEGQRVGQLHLAVHAHVLHLHARACSGRSRRGRRQYGRGAWGPCWPGS
jgi:hypothetical protein